MNTNRRAFLQLLCSGAAATAFPASIARALEIPAHYRTGTINDVEHIVFMMQENRSFDHYFGTLRGVRGFGDPRAVLLPSGKSVFYQPHDSGYVLPFHPGAPNLGLQFIKDLPHDWTSTHAAWNNGQHDQWIPNKGNTTMAHLTRSDIPFHYALADAFTICDAYHCSLLGPTDPNRYHMWTGWVGNDGTNGGPAVDNDDDRFRWSTYPEVLQQAGVSWKIYQDIGAGLNAEGKWGDAGSPYGGNYGDNALLYFRNYQDAEPGNPLHQKAKTGTDIATAGSLFEIFRSDVATGKLPQVSWIVAPEAYSEHPNWPANYGAWYVSQILDALTANPEVWSKTAFFLMYDENDGFFDHMVPPTPPHTSAQGQSTIDTINEIYPGNAKYPAGPYGLGVRVPMIVISPWSKGGWVSSEVFDHTSMIRFIERRFAPQYPGLEKTNITPWRRAVAGDLTSAFDFATPNDAKVQLPQTAAYAPPDNTLHPDYVPVPPSEQALPAQEEGTRPARAVPYELHVTSQTDPTARAITLNFRNTGDAAAVFHVRSGIDGQNPRSYTVGAQAEASDAWPCTANEQNVYDLSVYGPNGFFRTFKGSIAGEDNARLASAVHYVTDEQGIILEIINSGQTACNARILDAYTGNPLAFTLQPAETRTEFRPLNSTHGWYDLTVAVDTDSSFQQRFAGHLETGKSSVSDPAIGRSA
ncbi:MAG: phospholipase C, phosphocholine-specific [Silvibacterium sp.]